MRIGRLGTCLLLAPFLLTTSRLPAGTDQPDETLPGFKANQVYQSGGIDHVSLFNGDPGIVIPLGPEYPLSAGLTWQLRATYTSKFWTFDTDVSDPQLRYAYISGYPTLGVGWGLYVGYVDNQSYVSPTSGRHLFPSASGTSKSTDGSGLRRSDHSGGGYDIEFPDGSRQIFTHEYFRPHPSPDTLNRQDFSDDPWAPGVNVSRWGLKEIWDRFNQKVLTVDYVSSGNPPSPDAWKVSQINLTGQGKAIVWHWTSLACGTNSWPVLDFIEFPTANGPLKITFTQTAGSFARNPFDTASRRISPPPTEDPTVDAPLLSAIAMSGPNGQGGSDDLASYAFVYYPTDLNHPTVNGLLETATLPTGSQISYAYAGTAARGMSSVDLEVAPGNCDASGAPQVASETNELGPGASKTLPYLDSSAAVVQRTESGTGIPTSTITYCRRQSAPVQDGTQTYDDLKVAREVIVQRPDGNGNNIATKHIFTVDVTHLAPDPSNAGLELERRYYSGTDVTVSPLRTLVFCYESDESQSCGYWIPGATKTTKAPFVGPNNIRRRAEVTWYGENPVGGGDCSQATSPACWQTAFSGWNANALEYAAETKSAPNWAAAFGPGDWLSRTTTTHWTAAPNPTPWLLKLFDSRTVTDSYSGGCAVSPCSVESKYTFDSTNGFLTKVEVAGAGNNSRTHQFTNDGSGNPGTEVTSASGPGFAPSAFTTTRGFQNGLPTSRQEAGICWKAFDVDRDVASGLVTRSRDPNGLATEYSYDALGRLTRVHPPGGEADTTYCYVEASGATPAYVLAKKGWSSSCSTNDQDQSSPADTGSSEAYVFDGVGRLTQEIRRQPGTAGSYLSYRRTTYNAAGLPAFVSEWTSCGASLNVVGCFAATPTHGSTYGNYDFLGRARSIQAADGTTTTKEFSDLWVFGDRRIWNADFTELVTLSNVGQQQVWSATRKDLFGRVTALVLPIVVVPGANRAYSHGGTPFYDYNTLDRLVGVRLPAGPDGVNQTRTFTYDALGFLRQETQPETGTTTYQTYDARGNATSWVAANNVTYTATFDAASRQTALSAGTLQYLQNQFDGDLSGQNCTPPTGNKVFGRLTRRIGYNAGLSGNPTAVEDYSYSDPTGRLSLKTTTVNSLTPPSQVVVYESWVYNPLGLVQTHFHPRQSSDLPLGVSTGYRAGLPVLVTANGIPVVSSVTYHPHGGLASYVTGNGTNHDVTTTIAADPNGMPRPSQIYSSGASSNWATGAYSYDGAGNILGIGGDTFGYDTLSRLTSASLPGAGTQTFTYDVFGNLYDRGGQNPISLGCSPPTGPANCVDASTNRLKAYSYDPLGNLQNPPTESITYDALSRATTVSTGGQTYSSYYTGAGERVLRTSNSGSTYTFRDAENRVATEYAGSTPSRDNVFLGSLLVGSYSNGAVAGNGPPWVYYSSDHLGTPRHLTDNMGVSVETRRSWPFGEDVTPPNSFQRLRFATMERDAEGSRYYDHARSHSFGLARFMSPDKLGGTVSDPQSWNRYAYTSNNPLRYVDPDGRDVLDKVKGAATAFLSDVTWGLLGRPESENPDFQEGQQFGDKAALALAAAEAFTSTSAGGAALVLAPATGGVSLVAVAPAAAGIVWAAGTGAIALQHLSQSSGQGSKGWDPDQTVIEQLAGKGQLRDLRNSPNLRKVDIEALLQKTPRQLETMVKDGALDEKTLKQIKKAFEGRNLAK